MFYDPRSDKHGLRGDPVKSIIVPRPIGWISTLDREGRANLAPYSYFNLMSENPHVVVFSSHDWKHSLSNAKATGEFVCNLAVESIFLPMHESSAEFDADINEFEHVGLTPAPSRNVAAPRVSESPAALECKLLWTKEIFDLDGKTTEFIVAAGQVVGVHLDEAFIREERVDAAAMRPMGRLGYGDYVVVDEIRTAPRLKR